MDRLVQSGRFELSPNQLSALRNQFAACMASEAETTSEIARVWEDTRILIDPHTAVGVHAARQTQTVKQTPMIVLGTAHPAKFPNAIRAATGQHPALPEHLSGLLVRPEKMTILPNDDSQIAQFIKDRSRATQRSELRQEASL
jgi:threonine synthase